MKNMLLRKLPYTISFTGRNNDSLKVAVSPLCGLELGAKVYQVLREDGVIELWPDKIFEKNPPKIWNKSAY